MAESVNLWVASGEVTPRHAYVAYIIFDVVLERPYQWCKTALDWAASDGLKVQYGGKSSVAADAAWRLIIIFFFVGVIAGITNVIKSAKNMQK